MQYQKINESFYNISGTLEQLQSIKRKFTIKIPNAYFDPMIKRGLKPDSEVFWLPNGNDIIVSSGLTQFLLSYGIDTKSLPEFSEKEILQSIADLNLPFLLYDYQERMIVESIINKQQLCLAATASGKSIVIYCIVNFLYKHNKKGIILVPSISLTTQIFEDFKDYGANQEMLDSIRLIGGNNNTKILDKQITITTWQSCQKITKGLDKQDYILIDECLHPNTNITTKYGIKQIKDIKIGDEVLTLNESTYKKEIKSVVKVHKNISNNQMFLINNILRITNNHKVLTNKGWKRTDKLKIGDKILNANIKSLKQNNKNFTKIKSISKIIHNDNTYNLHIEDNHNYFADGYNVSNCHGLKFENKSTDIVYNAINAKYRIGLTGTLPEDPIAKMSILACVGAPKRYIKTQGLIERGLATPVHINVLKLRYTNEDKSLFKYVGNYAKQLKFVKEHNARNTFISKLSLIIANIGNTVIMCSHTEHMKDIFKELMKQNHPNVKVENKDIVGVKAVEFQNKYGIYYIAGATKVKDRDKIIEILKGDFSTILTFNNIKIRVNQHSLVLLSDGTEKKAKHITINDDVSDKWIKNNIS